MIRVMVVDDHRVVRAALRQAIDACTDMRVVGEASSGEEALAIAAGVAPHVALMDLSMPGISGLETTRRLVKRFPGLKVVAVSAHLQEPYPSQMLAAGAVGYIGKDCEFDEALAAIRRVHGGGRYLAIEVAGNLAANFGPGGQGSPFDQLSGRESEVMMMVLQGMSAPHIAEQLNLSTKTVSTYRHRLNEKLGVSNDIELARLAMRHGLFEAVAVEPSA